MPRKTVPIYEGDDFESLVTLQAQVRVAEKRLELAELEADDPTEDPRAGDDVTDDVREARAVLQHAKDEFDAFVDDAAERAEEWELTHIGFGEWLELLAEHPARTVTEGEGDEAKQVTHPEDQAWAVALRTSPFNTETFGRALLLFVDDEDSEHRTVTKLGGTEPGSNFTKRVLRLSKGQCESLWVAAHGLNTGGVSDPKLSRYSTDRRSDAS